MVRYDDASPNGGEIWGAHATRTVCIDEVGARLVNLAPTSNVWAYSRSDSGIAALLPPAFNAFILPRDCRPEPVMASPGIIWPATGRGRLVESISVREPWEFPDRLSMHANLVTIHPRLF